MIMDRTYPLGSEAFALAAETYRGPRERGQKREQLVDAVAATAPSEAFSSGLRAALLSVLSGGTPGAWGDVNGGRIPGQRGGAKAGHFVRGVVTCTQAPDRGPGCKAAPAKRVRVR